jgi:putative multicomponent Na+:H+ antiporter subunit B
MTDSYVFAIVALLPLASLMLMIQTSPYQALVIRGILGAVAALVYAVLGGADVALTEALVGTMLAITLYAVAVRSSLVLRLGLMENDLAIKEDPLRQLLTPLRTVLQIHHLRLELVPYPDPESLAQALDDKAIHGLYQPPTEVAHRPRDLAVDDASLPIPTLALRVPRIYDILAAELPDHLAKIQALPQGQVTQPVPLAPSLPETLH